MLWLGSIKNRAVICGSEKTGKRVVLTAAILVIMVGLVCAGNLQEKYAESVAENVWLDKMIEYYEEHKGERNVEPFLRY